MIRSCARRSLDAATIFIAFVICCVFFTARMRRRRSISDGMAHRHVATRRLPAAARVESFSRRRRLPAGEGTGERLHRSIERALQLIVELLLLDDAPED